MIISGPKSIHRQLTLFDDPVPNHAYARNIIGNLAEELTVAYTGGIRHRTDSRADYCPDVSDGLDYYESKAVGRSNTAFIYKGRLEKDRQFVEAGYRLWYVIWHHAANTKDASTVKELESLVLSTMKSIYVVPFDKVNEVCQKLSVEPLNSGYGGTNRKCYGSGYRINLKLLEAYMRTRFPNGYMVP